MSGHVPDWAKQGQYVMDGLQKKLITDFYFTSSPVHNSDYLILLSNGKEVKDASPLPVPKDKKLPSFIKNGELVEFKNNMGEHLEFIRMLWLKQTPEDKEGTVMVQFENYPFAVKASELTKVSKKNEARAKEMLEERNNKIERLKIFKRTYDAINREKTKPFFSR